MQRLPLLLVKKSMPSRLYSSPYGFLIALLLSYNKKTAPRAFVKDTVIRSDNPYLQKRYS